ncbi:hypothetical protein [Pseudomonas atacamensis]|jgi:hypothetical protein|uniref:hypothetical protein n=1 Tax=Pseudomonas atacamensis TaxID=2565368 RepID=UPI0021DA1F85|nr:hypothetical protein [Pseudomonas atacamensis]
MPCDPSDKYAARFGFLDMNSVHLDDFIQIMELVAKKYEGFFVFKVDGERKSDIYTFVLNASSQSNVVLRRDTDNIREGMKFFFCELERAGVYL